MNNPQLIQLQQVIESYIMGVLHERLFSALNSVHSAEDLAVYKRILRLQHVSLTDLGKFLCVSRFFFVCLASFCVVCLGC